MNSKRFLQKTFLSILIVTAILLGSFSSCLTVYAVEASGEALAELGAADTGLTVEKLVLSEDDVPEVIDFAEAQEKGHVLRLRSKESDDNTVVFLNDDNTETMYLFAEPVKYTDEHGNIKDKSTALSLESDAYTMAQNDVKVRFARDILKGVTVNKGGVNITMTPVSTTVNSGKLNADSNAELVSVNENKITYSNVFQGAELVYTTLYSGFKEDIVLESYDGINEFAFIVNTNGLYPVKQENGAVYFFEPNTDELVAKMMQVVCYDSAYNFAEGDVRITEVKANQIYGFTVVADSAFLTDEDTVYPVYVDPTIKLDDSVGIKDTVVYSGKPDRNYGSHKYLTAGYVDSSYKVGYVFYQFPTLSSNSVFSSLESSDVISATLSVYTASSGSGTEPLRFLLHFGSTWDASTVTYNTMTFGAVPTQFTTATVPTSGSSEMEINMSVPISNWLNGASGTTSEKGIYIANDNITNANMSRDFLSVEYALSSDSRSDYMPKLVINYESFDRISFVFDDEVDKDNDDNNILDIYLGSSATFDTIQYINGYQTSGGLTFEVMFENVITFVQSSPPRVTGISIGTTSIKVSSLYENNLFNSLHIEVHPNETISVENPHYIIDNDKNIYTNGEFEYQIPLSSTITRNGVELEENEDIVYSIVSCTNPNISKELKTENIEDTNISVAVIAVTVINNNYSHHETGTIKIKAASKVFPNYVYDYIYIDVVCNGDISEPESTDQVELCDGRYIRIPYDDTRPQDEINTIHSIYYGNRNAFSANVGDFEYVNQNFTRNTAGLFSYDYITAPDTHVGGSGYGREFFRLIRTSRIVFINTHGEIGYFSVNTAYNPQNKNYDVNNSIATSDIYALHNDYFANCDLIVVLSCYSGTANSNGQNIAKAFYDKGAKCVVGFDDSVSYFYNETFEKIFWGEFANNKTIEQILGSMPEGVTTVTYGNTDIVIEG